MVILTTSPGPQASRRAGTTWPVQVPGYASTALAFIGFVPELWQMYSKLVPLPYLISSRAF